MDTARDLSMTIPAPEAAPALPAGPPQAAACPAARVPVRPGRIAVLRHLLDAVRHVRPGGEPIGMRHQIGHLLRCLPWVDTYRGWYGNDAHPALQQALAERPTLMLGAVHPYLNALWAAPRKLAVIHAHYALLEGPLAFLRFPAADAFDLADLGEGLHLRLDRPEWFEHEGELTINLFQDTRRLYSLVFTLGALDAHRVAYVGALQGLGSADALEIYRGLTHRMQGLRPRDLLLTAFRQFCQAIGVTRILAVGDAQRVSSCRYFASHARVLTSYDSAWAENGARPGAEGFFELDPRPLPRASEDIASRKRAQYRRRYAMLEALAEQIAARLRTASPGADG